MESVLLLNQHSATSRSGRGKLVNASLAEHHIAVRRAELFDHRRRVHPFALLFARLRRCRCVAAGLRLPNKLALAEEDIMSK